MNNNSEKNLLYLQIFSSFIFIITIVVSIILTYNEILKKDKKEPLFDSNFEDYISLINRYVVTFIAFIFLYISYKFYEFNKNSKTVNISKKELIASIISFISVLILLENTIKNINEKSTNSDINIPII